MVKSRQLWPLMVLPFVFAIGLSIAAASVGKSSPLSAGTLSLVAIPCGLIGMSIAFILSSLGAIEDRIALLEKRASEGSSKDDSADHLPGGTVRPLPQGR